jgi:hypothetical protein
MDIKAKSLERARKRRQFSAFSTVVKADIRIRLERERLERERLEKERLERERLE